MNKKLYFAIGSIFTPNAPVSKKELFSGRSDQIDSLLRALTQRGSHAMIFGERGVGKTSLARIIPTFLPDDDSWAFASVSCDTTINFSSLWMDILQALHIKISQNTIGFGKEIETKNVPLSSLVADPENISVQDIRMLIEKIGLGIIVIDEIDRADEKVRIMLSDTVKAFSDYNVGVKLVLIGVGDSVNCLIKGHESVERALIQIHMPRMKTEEIKEIINTGLKALEMKIQKSIKEKIVSLSRGLPHYTHLLMFHAAQNTAKRNESVEINNEDFKEAIKLSVKEKEQYLKNSYDMAVRSKKGSYLFRPVLLACAVANCDKEGYFTPSDVHDPLIKILNKEIKMSTFLGRLKDFCSEEKGSILEMVGSDKKFKYRFKNPIMTSFVIMKAIEDGSASDEILIN